MAQARQVIGQLEHESSQHVSFANEMAELLFGQLVMLLNRHRYTSDSLPPTSSETLLDKLITRLAASLKSPLRWINFVMRHRAVSAFCVSNFASRLE